MLRFASLPTCSIARALLVLCLAVPAQFAPALVAPAEAASARLKRAARVESSTPTPAKIQEPIPLVLVVSLAAQSITVYSGDREIARAPISSGQSGHLTPTGVFSVIQKNRDHQSNLYDDAPMPFMQRLTWSGIALHAGKLPGYPASKGCVRMPYDFAERLFSMTRIGARVVVAQEVAVPQPIAHSHLPSPVMTPISAVGSLPATGLALSQSSGAPKGLMTNRAGLTLAATGASHGHAMAEATLNPMQLAEIERRRLALVATAAAQKTRPALEAAQESVRRSDDARQTRLALERHVASYRQLLPRLTRAVESAESDEDKVQAEASVYAVEQAITDALNAVEAARTAERAAADATFTTARAARETEDAAEAADQAAKLAARGTDPVTVFVSRKERRVLVRQGWQTILEGDVTIHEPDRAFGTHVFTAVSAQDATLSWVGVSIADGPNGRPAAGTALDRITIDPATAAEIGRRVWTGATLILSDQGVSQETGRGTDFIVLTK